jgi:hypothetical protein
MERKGGVSGTRKNDLGMEKKKREGGEVKSSGDIGHGQSR